MYKFRDNIFFKINLFKFNPKYFYKIYTVNLKVSLSPHHHYLL